MNLYQQELMDHYRNPRNRGTLQAPHFISDEHNPSCGDSVGFQGKVECGIVSELFFQGKGCVISQGLASMLTQECKGKLVSAIADLNKDYMLMLLGIPLGPTRLKCALLPLQALQQGISIMEKHII